MSRAVHSAPSFLGARLRSNWRSAIRSNLVRLDDVVESASAGLLGAPFGRVPDAIVRLEQAAESPSMARHAPRILDGAVVTIDALRPVILSALDDFDFSSYCDLLVMCGAVPDAAPRKIQPRWSTALPFWIDISNACVMTFSDDVGCALPLLLRNTARHIRRARDRADARIDAPLVPA